MSAAKPVKTLAVIDGKSVFYRGYYAMPYLSTKDGRPTGGVYGFATLAIEIISKLKPDYVCIAWDKSKTNVQKRTDIYPEYKANRKPAPADFYEQIPILKELLSSLGWPLYELDGYEADDIMGTLAVQAEALDLNTRLITSDLDLLQMVDSKTKVMNIKKGFSNIELVDVAAFELKYGIKKDQFVDYKALVGDSSDNIPGVAGVGPKTAAELLQNYQTLDSIYDNLWQIKPAWASKLEQNKQMAYTSQALARIFTDAPIDLQKELSNMHGIPANGTKLKTMLEDLEFRTLLSSLPDFLKGRGASSSAQELSSSDFNQKVTARLINLEDLAKLKLTDEPTFIYARAEGKMGKNPTRLYLSQNLEQIYIINLKSEPKGLGLLQNILLRTKIVTYDSKKLLHIFQGLAFADLAKKPVFHDLQIAAFIINSLIRAGSLTELAAAELKLSIQEDLPLEDLDQQIPKINQALIELYERQSYQLKDSQQLQGVLKKIDQAVVPTLVQMEDAGIKINLEAAKKLSHRFNSSIQTLTEQIQDLAKSQFNPASPKQLAKVLFEDLNLSPSGVKKRKTGLSTAADQLDKMASLHPIVPLIQEFRQLTKLKSTYLDPLIQLASQDPNSRVHGSFNLTVAATGRLSSSDPNLQNIPIRSELGKEVRSTFTAKEGSVLISADYSQVELRIAAAMSKDQELIDLFEEDLDVHTATAAQLAAIGPEEVSSEQRYRAKAVNFGILYGMGAHGLAVATGMTDGEARIFLLRYKTLRSKLFDLTDSFIRQANEEGFVQTFYGRRRPTPDIKSSNFNIKAGAERAALNMPIQGTSADITKLAMIRLTEVLPKDVRQILQVHDSIVIECPEEDATKIAKIVKKEMESVAPDLGVKLSVDTKITKNLE
jgi:DNA polymerase-1